MKIDAIIQFVHGLYKYIISYDHTLYKYSNSNESGCRGERWTVTRLTHNWQWQRRTRIDNHSDRAIKWQLQHKNVRLKNEVWKRVKVL